MVSRVWFGNSGLRRALRGIYVTPLLALTAALGACGGGGYMGSSSSSSPPPMAVTAKVAVGAITGFGNSQVHVNGLQFVTTGATITVDGKSGSQSDLHAGDVVQIKGHHDDGSGHDVADDIDFRGNVEGAITAIDLTAQTVAVLGQTVEVTADTSFDDDITPASLAGLKVGDVVEVSGLPAADGTIQATRIERHAAGALQVIGVATATDTAAKTLMINALLVDFSGATLADFPAGGPKDGDLIEASGSTLNGAGALVAMRLELRGGDDNMRPDPDDQAEVEGLITRFASATDFDVSGRAVATSASTTFAGGTAAELALNVRVEVEGTVDANGVIQASKVRIGHPAGVRIIAQVDATDATAGTVTVLGNAVSADDLTRFEDHGSGKSQMFGLADIHVGDWLEIRATQAAASSTTVVAMRIDRRQPQDTVRLSGEVASAAQPNFMVLSTNLATSAATQFSNGLDAVTFFTAPVGKTVSVRGSWDGSVLSASQVQLGDNDDGDDN